uniref:Uncharacterized protein n=1 Tax=Anguilla anguilla TaxID=7936 RepID=A0A0E9QI28_ANGAN
MEAWTHALPPQSLALSVSLKFIYSGPGRRNIE